MNFAGGIVVKDGILSELFCGALSNSNACKLNELSLFILYCIKTFTILVSYNIRRVTWFESLFVDYRQ
jgi:hypothetical protein